jgi:hypothetical protein
MDPVSALSLITEVAGLLTTAYQYGKAVKEAHGDMAKLYSELLGIKGALEQLAKLSTAPTQAPNNILKTLEFRNSLLSTQNLVRRLVTNLNKKQASSSRRAQAFLWPFVKDDVKSDILDLERVKSLLTMMMMAEDLTEMQSLINDTQQILTFVKDDHEARERANNAEARLQLQKWLQPVDPVPIQEKISQKRLSTTGAWFIAVFDQWRRKSPLPSRVLWLNGKSGSGKTYLMSTGIDGIQLECAKDPDVGFAFHYCSFADQASQETKSTLGSILYQLSTKSPSLTEKLKEIRRSGSSLSATRMSDLIIEHAHNLDRFYIFVDAVNESYCAMELIEQLLNLAEANDKIFLIITSIAPSTSSTAELQKDEKLVTEVSMNNEHVDLDMQLYVKTRMNSERLLRRLSESSKIRLVETILKNANKM